MTRAFQTRLLVAALGFVLLSPSPAPAQFLPDGAYTVTPFTPTGQDGTLALSVMNNTTGQTLVAVGVGGMTYGPAQAAIARYFPNESLDPSFGAGGVSLGGPTSARGEALTLQPDNKPVVAGWNLLGAQNNNLLVLRYTTGGQLDTSFNGTGWVSYDVAGANGNDQAWGVVVQSTGKIVVAGDTYSASTGLSSFVVTRFQANGALDTGSTGFGQKDSNGNRLGYRITTPVRGSSNVCTGLALQGDGKLVAVGEAQLNSGGPAVVVRYTAEGDLDTTFGTGGIVTNSLGGFQILPQAVTLDAAGNILLAGSWRSSAPQAPWQFMVARFLPTGALDTTFNHQGFVTFAVNGAGNTRAYASAVQSDGKILATCVLGNPNAGPSFAVVRLNVDGTLDRNFGNGGVKVLSLAGASRVVPSSLAILSNGAIYVGGLCWDSNNREYPLLAQFLP